MSDRDAIGHGTSKGGISQSFEAGRGPDELSVGLQSDEKGLPQMNVIKGEMGA